jgi:hypothetical protein
MIAENPVAVSRIVVAPRRLFEMASGWSGHTPPRRPYFFGVCRLDVGRLAVCVLTSALSSSADRGNA